MPGAVPVVVGRAQVDASGNLAAQPIVTTAPIAAGDAIVVCLNVFVNAQTLSSLTDGGDVFTLVQAAKTPNNFVVAIGYCLASAGLASGSTINVNLSAAPGLDYLEAVVLQVPSGLLAADASATATQGATTALSVGPTAATLAAVELAIAAFGTFINSATALGFTPGGAYTALTAAQAVSADASAMFAEYLVTGATGAQTATGTITGGTPASTGDVLVTFTYPAAAAAGGRIPSMPTISGLPSVGAWAR